jgi:acetolactate synthase-1/2/3 large subunit
LDIQGSAIEPDVLRAYDRSEDSAEFPPGVSHKLIIEVIERIKSSERPVLLAGSGIWAAGARQDFLKVIEMLGIPVVTGFNAHDLIATDHPSSCGRPGTIGDRAGNFVVQNSDLLLVLGCRLNIRQIGYNWKSFARAAFKIIVDIDPVELRKPTVRPDLAVHADIADFIRVMIQELHREGLPERKEWLEWCRIRKQRYPVVLEEYWKRTELVNPYCFVEALSSKLSEGQIVVTGNGSACNCTFQALKIKEGQRLFSNSGCASMGYDLPAAIGACFGANRRMIICITGDGSIQMNLQEFQTIVHYGLPIKVFVLNNDGYQSIRQTQQSFFGPPFVGCDPASGVTFPDLEKISYAYNIPFIRCGNHSELDHCISAVLRDNRPFVCEIMVTPEQPFAPKASSKRLSDGRIVSRPLEDLFPFLDRAELEENMIIDTIPEQ